MTEIVFRLQDKTKVVKKDVLCGLKKYCRDYTGQFEIILNDSCDFDVFCHFIDFLDLGRIPVDINDQIGVMNLLREWDSHFGIVECFRFRLCCQEKYGIFVYNGEKYEVNIGCLIFYCGVFREFYMNSGGMVFYFNSSYSRESFEVFLDLIHNRISYASVEKAGDVYDICNSLHCDSLCQLLNVDSSERVLSLLIQNQDHNDNIDFSKYERSITQNIETYLKNPSFCLVSLPSLCRIFADSNQTFSLSSLEQFLIGCMKHHGTGAQCILNKIKYHKPSDLSELNRFLQIMSIENANDIYDKTNNVLSSFQREFNEIRSFSERNLQIINELNSRLENQDKIIQELKSEISSAKATICEQNNRIQENVNMLVEKTKLIEDNEAVINEKVIQIKELTVGTEYSFKSDLFSGIFNGLSQKLGRDLVDLKDIIVTSSSCNVVSNGPANVLTSKYTIWHSDSQVNNDWIQFEFVERKVSITSYSMNDHYNTKSWRVEGLGAGGKWDTIDEVVDSEHFKNSNRDLNHPSSQKNFCVNNNNQKFYRVIRIIFTDGNWKGTKLISLWRVEFFGYVKPDN